MAFTSETGFRARQRKAGLASARYWGKRGYANLRRAREQRSINAWRRRMERWREETGRLPLQVILKCDCGRIHRVEGTHELSPDELRIVHGLARSSPRAGQA